jgi:hypothetical protein
LEALTFPAALLGYAGLTLTAVFAALGRPPGWAWRAFVPVILLHVGLVWAYRYRGEVAVATRNGYAGFILFHTALLTILLSAVVPARAASALVRLAFLVVSAGAVGAVFRYDEVGLYRAPVLLCAVAGVPVIGALAVRAALRKRKAGAVPCPVSGDDTGR